MEQGFTLRPAGVVDERGGQGSGRNDAPARATGLGYDLAGNLAKRTNNALVQTFTVNALHQLTGGSRAGTLTVAGQTTPAATNVTVNAQTASLYADDTFAKAGFTLADGNNTFTAIAQDALSRKDTNSVTAWLPAAPSFTHDANGNLTSDGKRGYGYDDENQLTSIVETNAWKSEFVTDGFGRRRVRREYTWWSGAWALAGETRYVYDGMLVIEERDGYNLPQVNYTRGRDLGGGLQRAGASAACWPGRRVTISLRPPPTRSILRTGAGT